MSTLGRAAVLLLLLLPAPTVRASRFKMSGNPCVIACWTAALSEGSSSNLLTQTTRMQNKRNDWAGCKPLSTKKSLKDVIGKNSSANLAVWLFDFVWSRYNLIVFLPQARPWFVAEGAVTKRSQKKLDAARKN
jgi:hypothetical protein